MDLLHSSLPPCPILILWIDPRQAQTSGFKDGASEAQLERREIRYSTYLIPRPSASLAIVAAACWRRAVLKELARPMGEGQIVPLFVNP